MGEEETTRVFLEEEHDFNALVQPLSALGLTRLHLIGTDLQLPASTSISNDVVISLEHFRAQERMPATFLTKWVRILCSACDNLTDKQLKTKIESVKEKAKKLTKNKKNYDALKDFLNCNFIVPAKISASISSCSKPDMCEKCKLLKNCIAEKEKVIRALESNSARCESEKTKLEHQISIKDSLLNDMKELRDENVNLMTTIKQLKSEFKTVCAKKKVLQEELEKIKSEANISATNCSKVIATVAKHLFTTDLYDQLPSETTSLNFTSEANVIAKSQVVEEIKGNECLMEVFMPCLREVCERCESALKRQLCELLDGGVFIGELEESVLKVLKTCPLTNLTGERLFGDLDYCINVRRNASLFLRSTRNMWKHNKTEKFLSKQNERISKKLLKNAIKYGPVYKQRSIETKNKILALRKAKASEQKKKKDEKAVKLLECKRAALDAVLARGSSPIITNKNELDAVYSGPQALVRLREQVRFRNLVGGEKIKITGTRKELYDRLSNLIAGPSST
ncbi:hypothetical protein PoB_003541400 [Plakobranchus ocellatus]|uniref:Uncharacterized protein n=1 Tax=Plakobranchus ocellatus TaxID=259542 RepID=A0AAV4AS12_9GAST|nr:hypothetical protein PoB_003541400 [Plakobranchus ocellatus]